MDEMPGALEIALACIVGVFDEHAKGDGDAASLSKQEFNSLMKEGLPHLAKCLPAEEVMGSLDQDNSGTVDFKEFMLLIGTLACSLHEGFSEMNKKQKK